MVEYRNRTNAHKIHNIAEKNVRILQPAEIIYLNATDRDREVIEANAPFLKDCCGVYMYCEAVAAALAFNFTRR